MANKRFWPLRTWRVPGVAALTLPWHTLVASGPWGAAPLFVILVRRVAARQSAAQQQERSTARTAAGPKPVLVRAVWTSSALFDTAWTLTSF